MSFAAEMSRLIRDALAPMLDERINYLEDRLAERLSGTLESGSAPPPLLNQREVASYLRVSPRTLQRMISAGEFPSPIPISASRARWRQGDVDAWLDERGRA